MKKLGMILGVGALGLVAGFGAEAEKEPKGVKVDTLLKNHLWNSENPKQLALLKANAGLPKFSIGVTKAFGVKDANVIYLYGPPGDRRFQGDDFTKFLEFIANHREKVIVRYATPDFGGAANFTGRQLALVKAVCDASGKIFVMQPGG